MIRKLIFLFCAALPAGLIAQVTISAQLPPAGLVQKDQLWNLVLVNNKEDILNVNIRMNLQDAGTGELVMSANTGMLLLNKGVKLISKNDIQPVLYNYNRDNFSKGFLPMGSYVACYQVYSTGEKGEELLGDECIKLNIDPLSPPLLTSPADKSEVMTPYPQFSWVPPAPYDMFTNLNYEIIVAEVLEGQSSTEAIQQNTPAYTKTNITQPYESYASSFTALQPEKTYAWQVVAKNESEYAVKTEVWTFKVKPPLNIKVIIEQSPFIKMKTNNPEKGIAPNGILKLSYNNETADTTATIHLVDLNSAERRDLKFDVKIGRGENLIQKDVQQIIHPEENKVYEAFIVNSRNEKLRVLFEVHKYNDKKL